MPARVTSGEEARKIEVEYPATVIARMGQDGDLMVDATSSQAFQRILLDVTAEGRDLAGRVGKLVPTKSTRLAEMLNSGPRQSCRLLKVEQSNSSIIYDDKIYLKLFRKLEEGINPDLALTKQLSDKCGFEHVPAYLGDIQCVAPGQDPGSVVVIQACAPNEQDGWSHTQGPSVDTSIEFLPSLSSHSRRWSVFGRKFPSRSRGEPSPW